MLVRKNLVFSLIFDMQYYYAVDLQTDDKGRMTHTCYLNACHNCLFCIIMPYFFSHALLLHKHLGKNKNEKLDLHLCDQGPVSRKSQ